MATLSLYEDDLKNPDELSDKLHQLAEIIVRKHFYASYEVKDELVSIGIVKAVKMINSDKFDPKKGNLCSFLYTGMRNDMHNWMYHRNKYNTVDFDSLASNLNTELSISDTYFEENIFTIDYSYVYLLCSRFFAAYSKDILNAVVNKLLAYGFEIDGLIENLEPKKLPPLKRDIADRIVGIILWDRKVVEEDEQ